MSLKSFFKSCQLCTEVSSFKCVRVVPLYTVVSSFIQGVGFQGVGSTVLSGVLMLGCWNRRDSLYTVMFLCWNKGVPLYTEVSLFHCI